MKRTKKLIFLAVSLFFLYGCELALIGLVGAGGGIAGYKYYEGHASTEFPLKYSKAWDASNTALKNLNISISSSNNNDTNGTIKGIQKNGKEVTIKLKERSQWVTTVSVRAGKLGKREDAERILNEIASVAGL
jgi:hypothetical protein